jgi:phospholipase/lecithinase/hemolysin
MRKLIVLFMLLACSNLFADPIKNIVFFGDSLSDNGNLYSHDFKIMPKDPPYYQGRFSDGLIWADYLDQYYSDHYHIKSANYAVGGATVVLRDPLLGCLPINLKAEIDDYFLHTLFQDRSDTLFVIMMGANDYNSELNENINSLSDSVVNEIKMDVEVLINIGAKHFLIIDIPDLSKVPRVLNDPTHAQRLTAVSQLHHTKIVTSLGTFKNQHPNVTFSFISMYDIFNDLLNNLETYNQKYHYNFTDSTTSCWPGGYTFKNSITAIQADLNGALGKSNVQAKFDTQAFAQYIAHSSSLTEAYQVQKLQEAGVTPCSNAVNHIFWDQIHPTTMTHKLFATLVEEALADEGLIGSH